MADGSIILRINVPAKSMTKMLKLQSKDSVATVVSQIVDRLNITNKDKMGLFLPAGEGKGGTWLRGDATLASYKLADKSVVHLVAPPPNFQPETTPSNKVTVMPMFGVSLEQALMRDGGQYELPSVIDRAMEYLDVNGLMIEGIYRLSGSVSAINELKKQYDDGGEPDLSLVHDVHTVSGLLKLYLRDLPEPVFTHALFDAFVAAGNSGGAEKARISYIRALLWALPVPNRNLIKHLSAHLARVVQYAALNKMELHNIGTVFGPNFLRPADDTDIALMVQTTPVVNQIASDVVKYNESLFLEGQEYQEYIGVARVLFDYQPINDNEIQLIPDAIIFLVCKTETGWWEGSYNGKIGLFPHNYVEISIILKEGNGVSVLGEQIEPTNTTTSAPVAPGAPILTMPPDTMQSMKRSASQSNVNNNGDLTQAGGDGSKKKIIAEVQRLQKQVSENDAARGKLLKELEGLEAMAKSLPAQMAALNTQLADISSQRSALEKSLLVKDSTIAQLTREKDVLSKQAAAAAQAEQASAEMKQLREQMAALQARNEQLEKERQASMSQSEQSATLQAEVKKARAETAAVQAELILTKQDLQGRDEDVARLEADTQRTLDTLTKMTEENARLSKLVAESRNAVASLEQEKAASEAAMSREATENAKAVQELGRLQAEKAAVQRQLEKSNKEVTELKLRVADLILEVSMSTGGAPAARRGQAPAPEPAPAAAPPAPEPTPEPAPPPRPVRSDTVSKRPPAAPVAGAAATTPAPAPVAPAPVAEPEPAPAPAAAPAPVPITQTPEYKALLEIVRDFSQNLAQLVAASNAAALDEANLRTLLTTVVTHTKSIAAMLNDPDKKLENEAVVLVKAGMAVLNSAQNPTGRDQAKDKLKQASLTLAGSIKDAVKKYQSGPPR